MRWQLTKFQRETIEHKNGRLWKSGYRFAAPLEKALRSGGEFSKLFGQKKKKTKREKIKFSDTK